MEDIVQVYRADVSQFRRDLGLLEKDLARTEARGVKSAKGIGDAFTNEGKKGFSNMQKEASKLDEFLNKKLSGTIRNIGLGLGVAFSVQQVGQFLRDSAQIALRAEGIEKAFARLNKQGLLDELRQATRGTISDLELMRNAVQANNFQIPLETLGSLFKFASQRARETGESVDFLVQSIVTGIARKSPLILDNLGINIQRINAEFKKSGDFAQAATTIINEELAKQGEFTDSAADKASRLSASFENFKREVGDYLVSFASPFEEALIFMFNGFQNVDEAAEGASEAVTDFSLATQRATQQVQAFILAGLVAEFERLSNLDSPFPVNDRLEEISTKIKELKEAGFQFELKDLSNAELKELAKTLQEATKEIVTANPEVEKLQKQLKLLQLAGAAPNEIQAVTDSIKTLETQVVSTTKTIETVTGNQLTNLIKNEGRTVDQFKLNQVEKLKIVNEELEARGLVAKELTEEEKEEAKKQAEIAKQLANERVKFMRDALNEIRQLQIDLLTDENEARRKQLELEKDERIQTTEEQYADQILKAKGNLAEISKLEKLKNQTLLLINENYLQDLEDLEQEFARKAFQDKVKNLKLLNSIQILEALNTGKETLEIRRENILEERDLELQNMELTELERKEIKEKAENELLKIAQEKLEKEKALYEAAKQAEIEAEEQKAEQIRLIRQQEVDSFIGFTTSAVNFGFDLHQNYNEALLSDLDARLKKQTISEENYEKQVAALKTKAAKQERARSAFNIFVQTAENVIRALGVPPVPNFLLAGIAGAQGLIQEAAVLSRPIPQFNKGTKRVPGTDTGKDSVLAMVRPGEGIMPVDRMNEYGRSFELMYDRKVSPELANATMEMLSQKDQGFAKNVANSFSLTAELNKGITKKQMSEAFGEQLRKGVYVKNLNEINTGVSARELALLKRRGIS